MAQVVLPIDASAPHYTVDVALGGTLYRFGVNWNDRAGFWTLDVSLTDDTPLVAGMKVVADWDLLGQFPDLRLPPGYLLAVDLTAQGLDPAYDDLGSRVILVFDDEPI
jgi:hypothetical protein